MSLDPPPPKPFEAVRQAIAAALADIEFSFPVEWEGGTGKPSAEKTWGRWTIQQGVTNPAIIGPGHDRREGVVYLQVFIPEGGGTLEATRAADIVAEALNKRQIMAGTNQITFKETGIMDAGRREGYTQKNVACNFTADLYS